MLTHMTTIMPFRFSVNDIAGHDDTVYSLSLEIRPPGSDTRSKKSSYYMYHYK